MKKHILLTGLVLFLPFFFASCTEDSTEPYTKFKDYSTFSANRATWTEPSNYSFTFKFSRAMQIFQDPITVTVKDGSATLTGADETTLQYWQTFESIRDVYDYFEKHWQTVSSEKNTNLGISFSAEYSTSGERIYPSNLTETVEWCGSGDAPIGADSGGVTIVITNFVIND